MLEVNRPTHINVLTDRLALKAKTLSFGTCIIPVNLSGAITIKKCTGGIIQNNCVLVALSKTTIAMGLRKLMWKIHIYPLICGLAEAI